MNTPKISVIIPCFNMEKYLSECMDSVLCQTLQDIEAICIDDGSTDATPELLDSYQCMDSRVRVLHQANQGVAVARNNGIKQATGQFIAFMDPDDFYPDARTLELLYTKAVEKSVLICGGSFSSYYNANNRVSTYYTGDFSKYLFKEEGYVNYSDYQFDFGYHRFLYNRAFLLEKNIFFPPYTRFQDPPFFVKAMIEAHIFYAVPDVVYRYRCDIQDEPTSWPRAKLHDMMRGHLDNLQLSAQAQLCDLHALTVRRFEARNVFEPVMKSLRERDPITLNLLIKVNAAIDPELLRRSGMNLLDQDCYTLRELNALLMTYADAKKEYVPVPIYQSEDSFSKQIFRKVYSGIQCCIEHGLWHTIKLAFSKFRSYVHI